MPPVWRTPDWSVGIPLRSTHLDIIVNALRFNADQGVPSRETCECSMYLTLIVWKINDID